MKQALLQQQCLIEGMTPFINKTIHQAKHKTVKLMPGMAVTAEVKTGTRRVIEFFLTPLLQHSQESLRER